MGLLRTETGETVKMVKVIDKDRRLIAVNGKREVVRRVGRDARGESIWATVLRRVK